MWKSFMRNLSIKFKKYLIACFLLAGFIGFGIYIKNENNKKISTPVSRLSLEIFEKLNAVELTTVVHILAPEEVSVCFLGEYEDKAVLNKSLSSLQMTSLENLEIPFSDQASHILFFSRTRLMRVFEIEKYTQFDAVSRGYANCFNNQDSFSVTTNRIAGREARTLHFHSFKKGN
jgi:hypothetical protein